MKYNYFCAIGGILLLGLAGYMVYADKDNFGWVIFGGIVLLGSTVISKKDIEGSCEEEDEE